MTHADPEVRRTYKKAWYQRNADSQRAKNRVRYTKNKENGYEHPYKKDPRRRRDAYLRRLYGIDGMAHWEAIFDAQGRKCACCGGIDPGGQRGWAVDHDHSNPKPNYRAILCNPCNIAIGNAKECPSRLRSCADYLDQAHQRQQQEITYGEE